MAERPKTSRDFIYGSNAVMEALAAGREMDKLLIRKGLRNSMIDEVLVTAEERKIPVQHVPRETLERLSRGGLHQGIAAWFSIIHWTPLEDLVISLLDRKEVPLLIMLDQVTDVRNFGAIARSAECLGAHGIIVPAQGSARPNMDAMKVSAGSLNHIPICREDFLPDAAMMLKSYGVKIVGCTEKTDLSIYDANFDSPTCIVMGAEDKGISSKLLKTTDEQVMIPMQGKVNSLNVSVATGVLLAEITRQRGNS